MADVRRFLAQDGVGLTYYRERDRETDATALPTVFLLHGFASNSQASWIEPGTTRVLAAAGREVIAVDARGHGLSDKPHDPAVYGESRMSRDLTELWDALDVEQCDLVGHSMGGVVALITAATDHRIRRLVLSGVGRYQLEYDGGPLPHFDSAGYARALSVTDPDSITEPELRAFRETIDESENDRLALAAHLKAFHVDPFAFTEITAQTLIIAGDRDTLSPHPDRLARAIENARSLTLPGDHAGTKTTPAFIDAVARFLD